ncbi:hypothetical protein PN36_29220 [Candidatus Thiomargarita nelsonii]|uniref:PIN domain-containing protein n=1 Tax=Candidatus Thiomargarita nelsonii TaxID=1003181 RepID=A0A0A6P791_9GAMM|nr:hypothetical protein PN36_29220 [Candidatus Thiomargarita nelsonii]
MKKRLVIDTNILIRFLTKDDPEQYQTVYALFQRQTETFLLTFDERFIKRSKGIGNCEVKLP